jgi:hypothetical protein
MIFAGIPKWFPYGYYTLLRLVVCGTGVYIAYSAFMIERKIIGFLAILTALLFNPIFPIYFNKETWVIIDIAVALFLGTTIFLLKPKQMED